MGWDGISVAVSAFLLQMYRFGFQQTYTTLAFRFCVKKKCVKCRILSANCFFSMTFSIETEECIKITISQRKTNNWQLLAGETIQPLAPG